jgi:hypothetical protein
MCFLADLVPTVQPFLTVLARATRTYVLLNWLALYQRFSSNSLALYKYVLSISLLLRQHDNMHASAKSEWFFRVGKNSFREYEDSGSVNAYEVMMEEREAALKEQRER